MDPLILFAWLLPTALFLGSFIIAKRLSRTRMRVADIAVVIWGAAGPTLMMVWPDKLARWTGEVAVGHGLAGSAVFVIPPSIVSAIVLGTATRSWIPVAYTALAAFAGTAQMSVAPALGLAGTVTWNAVVAGGLLVWALAERTKSCPPGVCAACGYSLAGLRESRCPECGEVIATGPARARA